MIMGTILWIFWVSETADSLFSFFTIFATHRLNLFLSVRKSEVDGTLYAFAHILAAKNARKYQNISHFLIFYYHDFFAEFNH